MTSFMDLQEYAWYARYGANLATVQQRPYSHNNPGYLPNGAVGGHPNLPPGAAPLLPNNGRIIQTGGVRVLCVADVRGEIDRSARRLQC